MRLSQSEEIKLSNASKEEKERRRTQITEAILNSSSVRQFILSGAGTGKTTIFSKKIEIWIKNGVAADKITVLSFINYIITDLKKELNQNCNVYTLHKLAKIIVHRFLGNGGVFEHPITNDFQVALEVDEGNIAEDISWIEGEIGIADTDIADSLKNYFSSPQTFPAPSFLNEYFSLCTFYDVAS
ncbi:MAG: UvrD-helicase domain-containing protein, partial [Lutibacter sp.]